MRKQIKQKHTVVQIPIHIIYSITQVPPAPSKAVFSFSASSLARSALTTAGADSTNFLAITKFMPSTLALILNDLMHGLQTPDEAFLQMISQTFGLGQTNWADKFWGIPNIYLGFEFEFEFEFGLLRIRDLAFVCP